MGRSRWSGSAPWLVGAAAASLALAISVGTGVLRFGSSGSQAGSAGGGLAQDTASNEAGPDGAGAAGGVPGSAGAGATGVGPPPDTRDEAIAVAGPPVPTVASGRDYGRYDLPRAPLDLAARAGSDRPAGGSAGDSGAGGSAQGTPPAGAPVELARLGNPAALRSCLVGLGAGFSAPLLVDFARFEGRPALVVLIAAVSPDAATTYVVGPSCSAADPDLRHVDPS